MLSDAVLWGRFKEDSLSLEEGHRESIYDAMRWAYDRAIDGIIEDYCASPSCWIDMRQSEFAAELRARKHQQEDA